MPRPCTVCQHPQRPEIDQALTAGSPLRNMVERFRVSLGALSRHKEAHIPAALAKAKEAAEVVQADSLLAKVAEMETEARRLAKAAEDAGDLRTALSGIRELVRIVELLARLQGELNDAPQVNITLAAHPEWVALRTRILVALESFPEARLALSHALAEAGDA